MQHVLDYTNDAFNKSGIGIEIFLHCIERYFGPEEENVWDSWKNYKVVHQEFTF